MSVKKTAEQDAIEGTSRSNRCTSDIQSIPKKLQEKASYLEKYCHKEAFELFRYWLDNMFLRSKTDQYLLNALVREFGIYFDSTDEYERTRKDVGSHVINRPKNALESLKIVLELMKQLNMTPNTRHLAGLKPTSNNETQADKLEIFLSQKMNNKRQGAA